MTYVYDILLNFHDKLYEFYEWNKDDKISHIKRINLVRVDSKEYNKILDYQIKLTKDFMESIFNKCEVFDARNIKKIPYAFLITDLNRVMALMFDNNGTLYQYSSLLLDEEEDILEIAKRLKIVYLDYEMGLKHDEDNDLTRFENHIINYLKSDFHNAYQEGDISKLKYLYYEYFNRQCDDIDKIMHDLSKELLNVNNKHIELYNLIKLSYSQKNA